MRYLDRHQAGRRLAERLRPVAQQDAVVVALPRGGVPVGYEVARALGAPLDILAVRKLGAPGRPEFGVGAITEDGNALLDPRTAAHAGMTQRLLDETVEREVRELRRRVARYREGRPTQNPRGRTAIVVDDGLATGLTALAAVSALRARGAARIVLGIPVGARESVALLEEAADEVFCEMTPSDFGGVGRWYHDFSPVSDEEVVTLLTAASTGAGPAAGKLKRPARWSIWTAQA